MTGKARKMKAQKLKPRCSHCGSRRTIKIGYRLASRPRMHKVQRIQCKKCGRTSSWKGKQH